MHHDASIIMHEQQVVPENGYTCEPVDMERFARTPRPSQSLFPQPNIAPHIRPGTSAL